MFLSATFGKGANARGGGRDSCGACALSAGWLSYRVRFVNKGVLATGRCGRITGRGTKSYLPSCRGHCLQRLLRGGQDRAVDSSEGCRPSGGSRKKFAAFRGSSTSEAAAAPLQAGSATPLPFPREPAGGAKVELCVRSSCLASRPASRRELGLPSGSPSVTRGFCVSGPFRADGRGTGRAGQWPWPGRFDGTRLDGT